MNGTSPEAPQHGRKTAMMNLGLAVDFYIQEDKNLFNFLLGRKE